MWRLCIALLCFLTVSCTSTKRLFTGEVYRVDTPWYDSRTDKLDPHDTSDFLIDIATYCFPEHGEHQSERSGAREVDVVAPNKNAVQPDGNVQGCSETAYAQALNSAIARDRLQEVLLDASNKECDKHKASSVGTNTGFNLGLSMLTSLLSGAATGFSATSTKTGLSAAATFFSSTRAQLNEQVYRQLFIGTLLTAIDNDRQAQLLDIMARRRYPVPNEDWDPRSQGQMLEIGRVHSTSDRTEVAAGEADKTAHATRELSDHAVDITEPEAEMNGSALRGETPEEAITEGPGAVDGVSLEVGPEERARAIAGDDSRRFYSIDEAIRDAADYHTRCSFYSGLVRLTSKVEEFSPCRLIEERRERLLAEVAAMRAAGVHESVFADKHQAYLSEIEALNTKMASCVSGGGG